MKTSTAIIIIAGLWAVTMAVALALVFTLARRDQPAPAPGVAGNVYGIRFYPNTDDEAAHEVAARFNARDMQITFDQAGRFVFEAGTELRRGPYTFDGKKLAWEDNAYTVEWVPGGAILSGDATFTLKLLKKSE